MSEEQPPTRRLVLISQMFLLLPDQLSLPTVGLLFSHLQWIVWQVRTDSLTLLYLDALTLDVQNVLP